jgi:hypothetical protein
MYTSFQVKNFRGFRDLSVGSLERVNLIAGKNNTGKTALLEAVFLYAGVNTPQLAPGLNSLRGIERVELSAVGIWGWLFFEKRVDETILLQAHDAEHGSRPLRLRLEVPATSRIAVSRGGNGKSADAPSLATQPGQRELVMEYRLAPRRKAIARLAVTSDGIRVTPADFGPQPVAIYLGARSRGAQEDPERFSKLEAVGRQDELLPPLRMLEPRLNRLAVLVGGGIPTLHADVGMGTMLPVPLMGDGVGRLLSLLLAIASAPGGTVLVDEVENGLHHSVLPGVWTALATAARQFDVQLFATTHSWECVSAAHGAFARSDTYDFRLHRLDRVDGDIRAVTYDQEALGAAISAELEVR